MPTASDRLKHVTLKIVRAKEHASSLESTLRVFLDSAPYKIGTKRDPETRKLAYYVTSIETIPDMLSLITGDAIQNLMGALDHLAYQIVCSDTADNPPNPNWIYFPIADDTTKYEDKKRKKINGALEETFDAIDKVKPYKGGNDLLWALHRINNIEKHRLLLTVGSQAAGMHIGQWVANEFGRSHPCETFGPFAEMKSMFESMNVYLMPANKGFPLKAGSELYIGAVDEEPNPKLEFRFTIVLNEPGIIEGKPLLETVNQFISLVEGIVMELTPLLR